MSHLLTPKLDLVFKLLFAEHTDILIDLLNAVLNLSGAQRIIQVTVNNPGILPEQITEKFIILDIFAVDERGRRYDIEMQAQKYPAYPERSVYYLCKIYANQLDAGELYEQLQPVIGIHFLNYDEFPGYSDVHLRFELRECKHHELRLTGDFVLHFLQLPKLENNEHAFEERHLKEWLTFFNQADQEGENMESYTNPAIRKAADLLQKLSANQEVRELVEIREKALRDRAWMLGGARREGLEQGRAEGRAEGEIIGQIMAFQRVLRQPVTPHDELVQKSLVELQAMLRALEAQL